MNTMETVRRFFDRTPQFTQLAKAMTEFARNDFHQPLDPVNFHRFVEREAGELDEESILEYCRTHLEYAGVWNLGLDHIDPIPASTLAHLRRLRRVSDGCPRPCR